MGALLRAVDVVLDVAAGEVVCDTRYDIGHRNGWTFKYGTGPNIR